MFTLLCRTLVRTLVLAGIVFVGTTAAVAQVPQSTPRPTPPQGDPTRPPGQTPIPGNPVPQNPTAPPGPVRTSPTTAPGTTPVPGATPVPQQPAGTVPGGDTQEPIREPNIPQFQAAAAANSEYDSPWCWHGNDTVVAERGDQTRAREQQRYRGRAR